MSKPTTLSKPPFPAKPGAGNGGPLARPDAPQPVPKLAVSHGATGGPIKVVLHGPGGIGKSSLAAALEPLGVRTLFLDLEDGTKFLEVARVLPQSFESLRATLHDQSLLADYDAVVIDSFTKAEELATDWTLRNVKHEKGHWVTSVEGYGFGKGYTHVYETFLLLLADLDALNRAGKHVVGICHDCVANVPNPAGEDWIRFEPRLQNPPKTGSIRYRVKEWTDHLLYIGYDVFVAEDGKGKGAGTRTIYPTELPTHMAKSRSLSDPIPYAKGDTRLWKLLLGKE